MIHSLFIAGRQAVGPGVRRGLWGWWLGALLPLAGRAQAPESAHNRARPDSAVGRRAVARLEKPRVVALYDARYSIINSHFCTINGLKLGLEWKNRLRTGAAVYFLSSRIPTRRARPDDIDDDARADLRFRYLALYGEYVLLETRRWELSVPLQAGLGNAYVEYVSPGGSVQETPHDFMGIVEPSVNAQMRVFRWGGLGAGAGWRAPVFVDRAVRKEISGPIFYLRGKLFLNDLVAVVRGRERLFSQKGLRAE
ncbi:hypothetical protein ACFQ48_20595 [Hymenobacter caeli]|uniref:DUF3575 domain-containing protein n=1 Tax=Hymenobacter caeli TaxID=2735894 RepID=A0ABX2FY46_9BACT|nr:hypothetical protein [Hymenobacter caeli]NRT21366.1 hypothetical protein [Hymenobacter caeli]